MSGAQPPRRAPIFLTDADVHAVFDWKAAVEALRAAYAAIASEAMFPPRTMARAPGIWLRTLSGIAPDGGVMGAKFIAASPRTGYASYLIPLFDQNSMELVALLDGNAITGLRTAATSALAVQSLVNPGAPHVAVIGSGFEAKTHIRALAAVQSLASVTVFSPNPESRAGFISELADLGIPMSSSGSAQEAVLRADLVICAARSRDESPTLLGAWLGPGMTVVSIGSTLLEQRELDPEAIARADLIVADMAEEIGHDTGDMVAAKAAGVAFDDKLVSLSDVVSGSHSSRTSADQIMLYKSVGAAMQDITVAALCVARARQAGVGYELPVSITPVKKGKGK